MPLSPLLNTTPIITSFYAAILALVFVVLSMRVIYLRRYLKIPLGAAQPAGVIQDTSIESNQLNELMLRAIRVQANFAEYIPFAIILMLFTEAYAAPSWALHIVGFSLLLGRLSHAYGVYQLTEVFQYRVLGMILTLSSLISMALFLIISFIKLLNY